MNFVILDISFFQRENEQYAVNFVLTQSDSAVDARTDVLVPRAHFHPDAYRPLLLDPRAYGKLLGDRLLSDQKVSRLFGDAKEKARRLGVSLRIRLVLYPDVAALSDLHWETL